MLARRLPPPDQLPRPLHQAPGQRGDVVARVQHVGLAALALLQPHEVRAGREERPRALAVQLQEHAAHAQRRPHRDQGVVCQRAQPQSETRSGVCGS